jgi:putative peptide zinc metalloprotease protein
MSGQEDVPSRIPESFHPVLRKDLNWIPYSRNHRWVLHDPVSNAFFYFNDIEHRTAQLFDGSKSLGQIVEICSKWQSAVASQLPWIESLTKRLYAAGLLMPTGGPARYPTHNSTWKRLVLQIVASPLAIRIPLIRPSGYSRIALGISSMVYHPWMVILGCISMVIVSLLLLSHWLVQPERLFFDISRLQGDRWLALLLMLLGIKTLHELGHYLACARWKVDCQELGFMLLCFSPCLYCDTTNAWKLRSRWERAAISAGGIYVELWLAIFGGLIFLNSDHEFWRTIGAGAWITCTVGTLLLNGNPCFRYDGYYILSDLWGVPNLGPQSQTALWQTMVHFLGGREPQRQAFDKPVWQLALFALVSGLYRCAMLILIMLVVWTLLLPNGFGILALLIIGSLGLSVGIVNIRFARGLILESFSPRPIHLSRVSMFLAAIAAVVWFVFYIPIPGYVHSRAYLEPENRQPLFMQETAGLVAVAARVGPIESGQLVLDTESFERRKEWLELKHQLEEVTTRIRLLEKAKVNTDEAEFELPTLRELQEELEARFTIKQQEVDALRIVASEPKILAPVSIPLMMPFELGEPTWVRRPIFDNPPTGASIQRGTVVGWLSSGERYVFQVAVPETEARSLTIGSRAEAILDSQPSRRWPCTVKRISPEPLRELPQPLVGDPSIVGTRDERGKMQFDSPHYQVVLEPSLPLTGNLAIHAVATIHFELPKKTIAEKVQNAILRSMQLP